MHVITQELALLLGLIYSNARVPETSLPCLAALTHYHAMVAPAMHSPGDVSHIERQRMGDTSEGRQCFLEMSCQDRKELAPYSASPDAKIFFTLANAAISQYNSFAPGTVVLSIKTTGVKKWFSTNTAALPTSTGTACVVDNGLEAPSSQNAELTAYTVIDGSHIRLSLMKPHVSGATLVVGGGCQFEPDSVQ